MYKILANTLFFGKNIVYVPECHSTNTLLVEMVEKANMMEGTLVITDRQLKGRGQRGNSWEAEPGLNLTFSILLRPSFLTVAEQFFLTQAISTGLGDYWQSRIHLGTKIKWPNDIVINDKKVTGILIENSLAGNSIQQSVVGIGVNINQERFANPKATSLKQLVGHPFDLQQELNSLLEKLEYRYLQLRAGNRDELQREYLNQLYRIGEKHFFRINGKPVEGMIVGIDPIGQLKLVMEGGERTFGLKEIEFL